MQPPTMSMMTTESASRGEHGGGVCRAVLAAIRVTLPTPLTVCLIYYLHPPSAAVVRACSASWVMFGSHNAGKSVLSY